MKFYVEPWAHQREGIERAESERDFAYLFDCGCGKTSTAINAIRRKFEQAGRWMNTLILGPPIVVDNWCREWKIHGADFPSYRVIPLVGPGMKRLKHFHKVLETNRDRPGTIFVTNYEALLMKELYAALLAWGPEILVLDESHKCKEGTAKRTKAATALGDGTLHNFLLTGTPTPNSPLDLFAQWRILDRGQSFGKNYFVFRARYFVDKNAAMPRGSYFPNWVIRPGALAELNAIIYKKAMRITKADALDLPPLVRQVVTVEMEPEQARLYRAMKEDYVAFLDSAACVGDLAITRALRLQQIVSGYVTFDDGSSKSFTDCPRLAALKELLEQLTPSHKVIVWAVFRENYAQIRKVCEALGVQYTELHGEVASRDRVRNVDLFNSDPQCRVLIGNQQAGGIGINLVSASYAIFFSRNFSYVDDYQAESRNHRGGSKEAGHEKITRIDLVAKETIDELVLTSLHGKQKISEELLKRFRAKL